MAEAREVTFAPGPIGLQFTQTASGLVVSAITIPLPDGIVAKGDRLVAIDGRDVARDLTPTALQDYLEASTH